MNKIALPLMDVFPFRVHFVSCNVLGIPALNGNVFNRQEKILKLGATDEFSELPIDRQTPSCLFIVKLTNELCEYNLMRLFESY